MASKKNHSKRNIVARWDAVERQAFADGNRARAATIPDKRKVANKRACRRGSWD